MSAEAGPSKRRASERSNGGDSGLGPCDACRTRRVKCIRLGSGDDDPTCEACLKRNVRCTIDRNGGQRSRPRQGKRIMSALATFGPNQPVKDEDPTTTTAKSSPSTPSHFFTSSSSGPVPSTSASPRLASPFASSGDSRRDSQIIVSDYSAEGKLGLAEESEALMATLMDDYISSQTFMVPLVRWRHVQDRFQRAGRRLKQLDVMIEPIVLACIAFGALVSDHPLIVGPDSPRLPDVRRLGCGKRLSHWARRRRVTCVGLADRVVQLVDQRGCFRVACTESVAALGVTSDLIAHTNGKQSFKLCRPYWAAQLAHLRHMRDAEDRGNELNAHVEWHLGVDDAFRSANEGQRLMMSDEEINDYFLVLRPGEPGLDSLPAAMLSVDENVYKVTIAAFWYKLIALARLVAKRVSIPLARSRAVSLSTFGEVLGQASEVFSMSKKAAEESRKLKEKMPPVVRHRQTIQQGSPLDTYIEPFPLAIVTLFMILAKQWREWKAVYAQRGVSAAGPTGGVPLGSWTVVADERPLTANSSSSSTTKPFNPSDHAASSKAAEEEKEEEKKAMARFEAKLQDRLADGVCLLAKAIEERRSDATELFSHLNPFAIVRFHFGKMAAIAVRIPSAEAGGPRHYTFEKQCSAVQTLIDALYTQAWVWPEMEASADKASAELTELRHRFARRQRVAGAASSPPQASPTPQQPAHFFASSSTEPPRQPTSHGTLPLHQPGWVNPFASSVDSSHPLTAGHHPPAPPRPTVAPESYPAPPIAAGFSYSDLAAFSFAPASATPAPTPQRQPRPGSSSSSSVRPPTANGTAYGSTVVPQTPAFAVSSSAPKASSPATGAAGAGTGWSAGRRGVMPDGSERRLSSNGQLANNAGVGLGIGHPLAGVDVGTGAGPASTTGWIPSPRIPFDPSTLVSPSPMAMSMGHHPSASWDQVLFDLAQFTHPNANAHAHAAHHLVAVNGSPVPVAGGVVMGMGIAPGYEVPMQANGPMATGGYGAGNADVMAYAVGMAGFAPDAATPL